MATVLRTPGKSRVMAALRALEAEQAKAARKKKPADVVLVDELAPAKKKPAKKRGKK